VVEYVLILAHNAAGFFPQELTSWISQVRWQSVGYGVLGLVLLRFAWLALRPNH
jgi:hypothetical protein